MSVRRRLGAAGAVVTIGTGWLALDGLQPGELGLTEACNRLPDVVITVLEVVMQLGTRPAIVLVAVVTAVVADVDWRRALVVVVVAGGLAWGGAAVGKDVVERPRPAAYTDEIEVRGGASNSGWPSSHTAVATGSLVAAAMVARRRVEPALVVATVVGIGRMAVGVHLPLDVVGGLGLGMVAAVLVAELADR